MKIMHAQLLDAFAQAFGRELTSNASAQNISNMIWSFARLHFDHRPFTATLTKALPDCIDSFGAQEVANTSWALARLNIHDLSAMALVSSRCPELTLDPQNVSNLAWSFATLAVFDRPLMVLLKRCFQGRASESRPQAISNTLWAMAAMKYHDHQWVEMLSLKVACPEFG